MALDFPNSPTVGQFFTSGGLSWQWDGAKWTQAGGANAGTPVSPPSGRLTLTSGVPVMTADVAAATTIYYTPYAGNSIPIYNGTVFVPYAFSELSLALSASAHPTSVLYDLFVWNNAGTLQLVSGPQWSSLTSRGAAAAITLLQGIYVNSNSMTCIASGGVSVTVLANQATYVGTFTAWPNPGTCMQTMNPAGASGGAAPKQDLWNAYNRRLTRFRNIDNGAPYAYTSSTMRQARASNLNQIGLILGLAEDSIDARVEANLSLFGAAGAYVVTGIGLDSNTASVGYISLGNVAAVGAGQSLGYSTIIDKQLGYHYITMLEASDNVHASTFCANPFGNTLSVNIWC
jgi:hypothetical protein